MQFNIEIINGCVAIDELFTDVKEIISQQSKLKNRKSVFVSIYDNYSRRNEENFISNKQMQVIYTNFYNNNGHLVKTNQEKGKLGESFTD